MTSSIWNENPTFYIWTRQLIFGLLTFLYPLIFYLVLCRTPKQFGNLKWFLSFHIFAITCQWLCSFLLIDFYTFVPSKITRIDGLLIDFIDAKVLYTSMYILSALSTSSCLLLFCNSVFNIFNMLRNNKSWLRTFSEWLAWTFVLMFPFMSLLGFTIRDQPNVKALTKQISSYYPDCIDNPNVIVPILPDAEGQKKSLVFFLMYLFTMATASILSAQLISHLLSKRMTNQSDKTKKMHQKFNRRSLFQVLIDISFTSFPYIISNFATLFQWRVPELTYFVDFMSKSGSTACIFVIFMYYDPYRKWLQEIVARKSTQTSVRHVTIAVMDRGGNEP